MKIERVPAKDRFFRDIGWLASHFIFSFDDYHDPKNQGFGKLRVLNHDKVSSGGGFPMHPHRNYEILTIVLKGELLHASSMGEVETLKESDCQLISAGTGIEHSEGNNSKNPVELLQIWLVPKVREGRPSYQKGKFPFQKNYFRVVASLDKSQKKAMKLNSEAGVILGELTEAKSITYKPKYAKVFFYVLEGKLQIETDTCLEKGDQARIAIDPLGGTLKLRCQSKGSCKFLLVESA